MEIKRRLNKIASRLTPQIEVMNIATEMQRMCQRFEELLDYGEEKVEKAARKGETMAARVDRQRKEEQAEILRQQKAESDENRKDQEEAAAERQKLMDKSKKNPMPEQRRVEVEIDRTIPPGTKMGDQFGDGDGIPEDDGLDRFYSEDAKTGEIFDPRADAPQSVQDGTCDDEPVKKKTKKKTKKKAKRKAKKKT